MPSFLEYSVAQAILSGILTGGFFALMTAGLGLIWGVMDIANASQASLAVLAAYVVYWLNTLLDVNPFVGTVVSAFVLFGIALPIYKIFVSRLSGDMAFTFLFMFAVLLEGVMLSAWSGIYRAVRAYYLLNSFQVFGVSVPLFMLVGFAYGVAGIGLLAYFLKSTYIGKAIRAAMQNPTGASLMGINVNTVYLLTFGIGFLVSGFAGGILGMTYVFVPTTGDNWIALMFAIVALGGLGSMTGILLGSFVIGLTSSIMGIFVSSSWGLFVAYVILVLILWVRPRGLLGKK